MLRPQLTSRTLQLRNGNVNCWKHKPEGLERHGRKPRRPTEVLGRRVSNVSEIRSSPECLRAPSTTTLVGTVSENPSARYSLTKAPCGHNSGNVKPFITYRDSGEMRLDVLADQSFLALAFYPFDSS
jgi:hypothetical protein